MKKNLLTLAAIVSAAAAHADPQLASWYTADSGQYARIYQTTAAETARAPSTTWSRGSGTQTNPTYSGVSEIVYSALRAPRWRLSRFPRMRRRVRRMWSSHSLPRRLTR